MVSGADGELSRERFRFMIFLSACAHALLVLGVGFTYLTDTNNEATIEVTLAQYRSQIQPDDADFIARKIRQAAALSMKPPFRAVHFCRI